MASEITLSLDFRTERFQNAANGLKALGKRVGGVAPTLAPVLRTELRQFLGEVARALALRHSTAWSAGVPKGPVGASQGRLYRRSGVAMQSIKDSVKVTGTGFQGIKGVIGGVGYLRTHELGATIRPKKGKFLAIPLPPALNANGAPKKRGPRDWDRTFVIKSKKGNLLIVQRKGKDLVPLYLLKDQVVIPPRLGMGETLRVGIPFFVDRTMDKLLKEVLRQIDTAKGVS